MREMLRDYFDPIFNLLNYNIFALGDAKITPLSIIYLLLLTVGLIYLSKKIKNVLVEKVLGRTKLDIGARQAIGTISRYFVLFLGFLVILQTVGINLTTLNVLAGAVGIGVGFGLQNVASNFISGLIILMERPVKVGDRIEVDKTDGKVVEIGARSTRVRTNDNITIIVPNSKLISETVRNWSYRNKSVRFRIPVDVAYDADIELVKRLLLEVAQENTNILTEPKAAVMLLKFDDNALYLELSAWTETQLHRKAIFSSDINFAILQKFRKNNIKLPSSQTDVFIKNEDFNNKNSETAKNEPEEEEEVESVSENFN